MCGLLENKDHGHRDLNKASSLINIAIGFVAPRCVIQCT